MAGRQVMPVGKQTVPVSAANWQIAAKNLENLAIRSNSDWRNIINHYDEDCFFVALARDSAACDVVFWRLKSESQRNFAEFFRKVIRLRSRFDSDVKMKCGYKKYNFLLQYIEKEKLAFEMGCEYLYAEFIMVELNESSFPEYKPYCARKHIRTEDIEEDVYQMFETMEQRVEAILDMFKDHYAKCNEQTEPNSE